MNSTRSQRAERLQNEQNIVAVKSVPSFPLSRIGDETNRDFPGEPSSSFDARDCDESLAGPVTIVRYLNERRSSGFRSPLSYGLDRLRRSRPHACTLAHTDDGAAVSTRIKTASSVESARHSRESRLRACLPLASEQRIQGRESEHRGGATKKGERQGGKRGKERQREARLRVAKRVPVRTENEAVRASRTGVRFANARVGSFT